MDWDLYKTVPVMMSHPALRIGKKEFLTPVIVSKIKDGIVWWNLDFIVNQAITGQGGSGLAETPIFVDPVFEAEENRWACKTQDGTWDYYFYLPDKKAENWWQENKKYVWPIERLNTEANKLYPDGGRE